MLSKVAKLGNYNKLTAPYPCHSSEGDRIAGIRTTGRFRRFAQRDDMFSRAFWDGEIRRPEMMEFFDPCRGRFGGRL